MKKILISAAVIATLVFVMLSMASCDKKSCDGAEVGNGASELVRENPTCTSHGYIDYKCDNGGHPHTVIIPALGHEIEWIVDKPSTCNDYGLKHKVCKRCGETLETNVIIPANGHKLGEKTAYTEPTCTKDGALYRVCSVCDAAIIEKVYPKLGHDIQIPWDNPSYCPVNGNKHGACTRCEYMYGTLCIEVAPTCTATGEANYKCTACDMYKEYVVPALGHDFKPFEDKAGCITDGKKYEMCTRCNLVLNEEVIQAHGHDFDPKTDICKICKNHKYTVVVKYQLPDESFVEQYTATRIIADGDPVDSLVVLHGISGYNISGVYFDSVDDYVITIVVKYKAK